MIPITKFVIYHESKNGPFLKKNDSLNFGNSGTLARLLIGILTSTPDIKVKISGDHSLKKRSMKSLIQLMEKFDASFFQMAKKVLRR